MVASPIEPGTLGKADRGGSLRGRDDTALPRTGVAGWGRTDVSEAVKRLNGAWRVFPDFAVHRIDLNVNGQAPFMMGLADTGVLAVSALHSPNFVLIDMHSSGAGDTAGIIDAMVGETFDALFFGWSPGGPCVTSRTLLNAQEPGTSGISDVGRMVLYYFALR